MSPDPYATTDDGNLYVVTSRSWGRSYDSLKVAKSLADAKARHGWTRAQHTTITVRRARQSDVERIGRISR